QGLDMHRAREMALKAHAAKADIQICAMIFSSLTRWSQAYASRIKIASGIDEADVFGRLAAMTQAARFPLVMNFGKHEGARPWEIALSYRSWYANQEDPDPYMLMAMRLNTREETPDARVMYDMATAIFEADDSDSLA